MHAVDDVFVAEHYVCMHVDVLGGAVAQDSARQTATAVTQVDEPPPQLALQAEAASECAATSGSSESMARIYRHTPAGPICVAAEWR